MCTLSGAAPLSARQQPYPLIGGDRAPAEDSSRRDMDQWFSRFGNIPGVKFEGSPGVDRRELPGHDAVQPRRGSASPVHSRAFAELRDMPTAKLLQHVNEGLELPGAPGDYHFLIEGCTRELWARQRQEPEVLEHVERLCRLNLQLIEACPDAIRDEKTHFAGVLSFYILIRLYEGEGSLREALEVAEQAVRLKQCEQDRQRLLERIAAVEGESSG
jgi:hypothetical protein